MDRILTEWAIWVKNELMVNDPRNAVGNYLIFQLYRHRHNPAYSTTANVKSLFKEAAREKYIAFHNHTTMHFENQWLSIGNFSREEICNAWKHEHPYQGYVEMQADDEYKRNNQRYGDDCLMLCKTNTLMWSPASDVCARCKYIAQCKVETKKLHPELYRLRLKWRKA
ncbi:MAG: hypothetical protein IKO36_04650 [Bacteroidaceae bacterium]|nr:hypothetical protein [Bacteroidaceae bacterium]